MLGKKLTDFLSFFVERCDDDERHDRGEEEGEAIGDCCCWAGIVVVVAVAVIVHMM